MEPAVQNVFIVLTRGVVHMNPLELLALFIPFVLNWALTWLTILSEKDTRVVHKEERAWKSEQAPPRTDETLQCSHAARRRPVEAETGSREITWNVSNFFGLKQAPA
jgi:hypothetical protein